MSSFPLQSGARFDSFVLKEKLGRGGYSEVWSAVNKLDAAEKLVALKFLVPGAEIDFADYTRFVDEVRVAKSLDHANIVRVFNLHYAQQFFAQSMELVDGLSLSVLLARFRRHGLRVPVGAAVALASDIAGGLTYMHECMLLHRDVSPQNVFVSREGIAKMGDFGITVFEDRLDSTDLGVVKGKLAYMSPEQLDQKELTAQSDIFSTGILYWELFTNRRLFPQITRQIYRDVIAQGKIPNVREFHPEVPEEISALIPKMLEPDKDHRLRNMETAKLLFRGLLKAMFPHAREEVRTLFGALEQAQAGGECAYAVTATDHALPDSEQSDSPTPDLLATKSGRGNN